jgi:hypothetical protein
MHGTKSSVLDRICLKKMNGLDSKTSTPINYNQ